MNRFPAYCCLAVFTAIFSGCAQKQPYAADTWPAFNGDKTNSHFSTLKNIDTNNVKQLRVAWQYRSGDADTVGHSQIQTNPLMVNGMVYGVSPQLKLFALDAASGKEKWRFDPFLSDEKPGLSVNRGLSYWADGDNKRIFFGAGPYLYAVDAITGKVMSSFGQNGRIDLRKNLDRESKDLYVAATTPGIVFKNTIIMGSRLSESGDGAPGHIRAFDLKTGKRKWIFHTLPYPGEPGYETWENKEAWKYTSGVNVWAGFALDEKRGIVYAPTGSATNDFYGGLRKGANLYANCLLALDAETGKLKWHFQTIHHDMWDRDLPSAPNLFTADINGKKTDAVSVATKTGFVFVLDRETGKPLFPVKERPVPHQSELKGEQPWPTQPVPVLPKPFVKQGMTAADLNTIVPESSQEILKAQFAKMLAGNNWLPPGFKQSILFPGLDGGAEWGGSSFDPETGYLYINSNHVPWLMQMEPTKKADENGKKATWKSVGEEAYISNCASCHGAERKGNSNIPALVNVGKKYGQNEVQDILANGRRMMPAFKQLSAAQRKAIGIYLLNLPEDKSPVPVAAQKEVVSASYAYPKLPYMFSGYKKFQTPEGYPANNPPWGTLLAINMNNGKTEWQIPFGEYPELEKKGIKTGTENYGGSVVTAGGILFIAATRDGKCRAYNKRSGKLLWEAKLPYAGFATPSTYKVNGRQYFVVACGGGKLNTTSGDAYVAFSLP